MNTSLKTKHTDEIAYSVMIISQSKDGSVHYDGYQESDPEKDELTQILSYIVDEDWETASTYSECYTLLRNQITRSLKILRRFTLNACIVQRVYSQNFLNSKQPLRDSINLMQFELVNKGD